MRTLSLKLYLPDSCPPSPRRWSTRTSNLFVRSSPTGAATKFCPGVSLFGSGYRSATALPIGLEKGIKAFGNGCWDRKLIGTRLPGPEKSPLRSARVGTLVVRVAERASRSPSKFAKTNAELRTIGPPSDAPNWFLRSVGTGSPGLLKKLRASNRSLRRNSYAVPWSSFVPCLMATEICPPVLRPSPASEFEVWMRNSLTASTGGANAKLFRIGSMA